MSKEDRVGEIRPSQILYTYGVGATIDFPYISALVSGLDDWPWDPALSYEISEERLLALVRKKYGAQVKKLLSLPVDPENDFDGDYFHPKEYKGIPAIAFPSWLHCTACNTLAPLASQQFELKSYPNYPEKTHFVHSSCTVRKNPKALPARFVVCCEDGHLDDFPWMDFVHSGRPDCEGHALEYIDNGISGEMRDLEVKCRTCGASKRLALAFGSKNREIHMPLCSGNHPHLHTKENCSRRARAIQVGSSNLWFPEIFSVISIPDSGNPLADLVSAHWKDLSEVQVKAVLEYLQIIGILNDFNGFTLDEIMSEIDRRRKPDSDNASEKKEDPDPLLAEWQAFRKPCLKTQTPDFKLTTESVPNSFSKQIEQVILVERMREVRALTGFSRVYAPGEVGENKDAVSKVVPLTVDAPTWFPALEVRGEGIFIQFRESEISAWMEKKSVQKLDKLFKKACLDLQTKQGNPYPSEDKYKGIRYVLLHSFSHALMRELSLECGYNQTSIRERIYASASNSKEEPMAGVLIYTSSPDAEGTLGGLVEMGKKENLEHCILNALEACGLCSSDPTCSEHYPSEGVNTLHGAACHSCLFVSETSCEQGNRYLDRSVLVPTLNDDDRNFFDAL